MYFRLQDILYFQVTPVTSVQIQIFLNLRNEHHNNNLNLLQYKEKMAKLESQLEDERKKAEDLQFTIDEATITAEESNVSVIFCRVLDFIFYIFSTLKHSLFNDISTIF